MRPASMVPILAALLLALMVVAGVAQATPVSGNSAADQYIEAVPTAGGRQSSPPAAAATGAQPAAVNDKEATSALAKATAPNGPVSGGTDSSGMGIALPLIMLALLIGASIWFWARRRSDGASAA
jgi:hypothetical protein